MIGIEIYFVILAIYIVLILGFWFREYTLAALASLAMMGLGVYGILNGIGDYNNLFTLTFSIVSIGLGAYVLIRGAIELIEENYNY
jgi:hypothetical protein